MKNSTTLSLILLSFFVMTPRAFSAGLIKEFAAYEKPDAPECTKLDLFLKQFQNTKLKVLEEIDKKNEDERLNDAAVYLFPLAMDESDRATIMARCGSELYELHQELGELMDKPEKARKSAKKKLKEKATDWKNCLNEMTKEKLGPETAAVVACHFKLIDSF